MTTMDALFNLYIGLKPHSSQAALLAIEASSKGYSIDFNGTFPNNDYGESMNALIAEYDMKGEKWPCKLSLAAEGIDPMYIHVDITNQTEEVSLFEKQVRFHYGSYAYSHCFALQPSGTDYIAPHKIRRFTLSYDDMIVNKYTDSSMLPYSNAKDRVDFYSAGVLFHAIAAGSEEDSWVEIDFNDVLRRKFLKGKVKYFFEAVEKYMIELKRKHRSHPEAAITEIDHLVG